MVGLGPNHGFSCFPNTMWSGYCLLGKIQQGEILAGRDLICDPLGPYMDLTMIDYESMIVQSTCIEEEEERSDRWKDFLERQCESAQLVVNGLSDNNNVINSNVESTNSTTAEDANGKKPDSFSEDYKDVPSTTEAKVHQVQLWTEIRPSLRAVEDMMSSRVQKKVSLVKNESGVKKQLPPIEEARPGKGASEDDSEEEFYDLERSESDPIHDILLTDGIPILDMESLPPWKQELECLVQGGVPMALRGELWQAFVGVRARRVEKYYQNLLSSDANVETQSMELENKNHESNLGSVGVPEKWKTQIEKDLPRTFPGHPALDEDGRNALRRLLTAYARHNPSVGYCQVDQLVLEELVREKFPKLGPALVTTKDAGDAVTLLQSLAGSTFDSSQLVLTACMGYQNVQEVRLQELRNKHRPAVKAALEERSKGVRVWKDSQGLASKLYSFKKDPGSVMIRTDKSDQTDMKMNGDVLHLDSSPVDTDDSYMCLNGNVGIDSAKDLEEQVVWLKVELCKLLDDKRSAELRAEELETALMEMVKQDNRRQLSARVEQLEQEVTELKQALADKQEQENAMLQEKYEEAAAALAEMEKRAVMAESMLEATLQYQSGQNKAQPSPRSTQQNNQDLSQDIPTRKISLLSRPFGLGWRDRNKGKPAIVEEPNDVKPPSEGENLSLKQEETNGHPVEEKV
ncbi:hypothetical protein DH2020_010638 [Rehmannia glutinosa]|uniref:Rab-GAP TBC domain-containing protein n=1 Tax=Rehmannia glutinosa TaxID=99300 RepID=A0ABR0XB43_REHGL